MGCTMYAGALDEPNEFIRIGKTAGFEGTQAELLAFIQARQNVVIFREDSVPVKKWATADGFFNEKSMPQAHPLDGLDPVLVEDLAEGMSRAVARLPSAKGAEEVRHG